MSRIKTAQTGFTLVELMIGMVIIGILSTAAYTFFMTSMSQYIALQRDGMVFGDLAMQSQRISNVLRGATGVNSATDFDLTVYAYFAPNDNFVSKIRYYRSADGKKLQADLTQMTANPPIGTEITSSKRTITILSDYTTPVSTKLFTYYNSAGTVLVAPVADTSSISSIKTTMAVPSAAPVGGSNTTVSSTVSLRNRKYN